MLPSPDPHAPVRGAARWLGIGVAAGPIADVADRSGLLGAAGQLEAAQLVAPGSAIAWFLGVGIGVAWLLRRQTSRGRLALFAACAAAMVAWITWTGPHLPGWIAVIALAWSLVLLLRARSTG